MSSPTVDTDAEWVAAAYAAHGRELYRFALRSLGDSGLAEEAVQTTYLRAWRAAARFDESLGSMRTWLFAIVRNVVVDMARARNARPSLADASLADTAATAGPLRNPTSTACSSRGRSRRHCAGCRRIIAAR